MLRPCRNLGRDLETTFKKKADLSLVWKAVSHLALQVEGVPFAFVRGRTRILRYFARACGLGVRTASRGGPKTRSLIPGGGGVLREGVPRPRDSF